MMSERSHKPMTLGPGSATGARDRAVTQERRATPRFPFTAACDALEIGSQTRVAGRSSDLGPNGCYIDTITPLAAGAIVRVRIRHGQRQFEAKGVVKYSLVSMGMGLALTEISPEHQALLQEWMAELRGERAPESETAPQEAASDVAPAVGNIRQVLNELINLMIRRKIISEQEGAALLRQMFR
jgi:hypothetical protein